jgi:hypothetical protein
MKKLKKNTKVIGIRQTCPSGRIILNPPEKLSAEAWESVKDFTDMQYVFLVHIIMVV